VAVVVHDDGRVDIEGDDLKLTLWNHDPGRLRSALDYCGRAGWKPRYHVLSLPGNFGFLFNMATWDRRTPCVQKVAPPPELQTTVDRVLWEAREYGGYTVPASSFPPGDEVEIAKALRRGEMKLRHLGAAKKKAERKAKDEERRRLHAKLVPPSQASGASGVRRSDTS
jgi:hypothetical protein